MKIVIERDKNGLNVNFNSSDWDHYEVIGMLEMAKHAVQKEVERMLDGKKTGM